MRRALLIIAAFIITFQAQAVGKNRFIPEIQIQGEYRRDTLDYDEVERQFTREKAGLVFNRKSSINLTHVYINAARENRVTWNIAVGEPSPYFSCILGNFNVNFGSGLIIGKKKRISPDLFSRKLTVSQDSSFDPCSSGNPIYCFQGIAAAASCAFTDIAISLKPFFSVKNRYANKEIYGTDQTENSFNSILYRIKKNYLNSEPVVLYDYGCAAEINIGVHITIQSYFIYSNILRKKNPILWSFNDRGVLPGGIKGFYAYGLSARYRDDYIDIFFELGISNRAMGYAGGKTRTIRDYGLMYGLKFRYAFFRLSLTGKNTGKNFFSPYSSGNSYAEHAVSAGISVVLFKKLRLGGSFFAEKQLSPVNYERFLRCVKREQAFCSYRLPDKGLVQLKFNYVENEKRYGTDRYLQIKPSVKYCIHGSILLTLSGIIQKKGGRSYSGCINTGFGIPLWNFLAIFLYYSYFNIAKNNLLHSVISPSPGAITPGRFIKKTSNAVTGKISVRYKDAAFTVKYEHNFIGNKTIQQRIELFGKCLL